MANNVAYNRQAILLGQIAHELYPDPPICRGVKRIRAVQAVVEQERADFLEVAGRVLRPTFEKAVAYDQIQESNRG